MPKQIKMNSFRIFPFRIFWIPNKKTPNIFVPTSQKDLACSVFFLLTVCWTLFAFDSIWVRVCVRSFMRACTCHQTLFWHLVFHTFWDQITLASLHASNIFIYWCNFIFILYFECKSRSNSVAWQVQWHKCWTLNWRIAVSWTMPTVTFLMSVENSSRWYRHNTHKQHTYTSHRPEFCLRLLALSVRVHVHVLIWFRSIFARSSNLIQYIKHSRKAAVSSITITNGLAWKEFWTKCHCAQRQWTFLDIVWIFSFDFLSN